MLYPSDYAYISTSYKKGLILRSSNKVIILLLSLNLAATVFFGFAIYAAISPPKPYEKPIRQELPMEISTVVQNDILDRFIMHFNGEDYVGLYNMLGENAKAEFSEQDKAAEFARFGRYFHNIKGGRFTDSKFVGRQNDTLLFALNYHVELSKESEIGDSGNLKVTIEVDSENPNADYQIYNLYLHASRN